VYCGASYFQLREFDSSSCVDPQMQRVPSRGRSPHAYTQIIDIPKSPWHNPHGVEVPNDVRVIVQPPPHRARPTEQCPMPFSQRVSECCSPRTMSECCSDPERCPSVQIPERCPSAVQTSPGLLARRRHRTVSPAYRSGRPYVQPAYSSASVLFSQRTVQPACASSSASVPPATVWLNNSSAVQASVPSA
jgi:hypothetical protein